MQRALEKPSLSVTESSATKLSRSTSKSELGSDRSNKSRAIGTLYLYVFGNLLSQGGRRHQVVLLNIKKRTVKLILGGPCASNRLPFRIVAGVWTLGAFIFVQAYTSTLFTYVVTPIRSTLIDSIEDVAKNTDIKLFVKKAGTPDHLFSVQADLK